MNTNRYCNSVFIRCDDHRGIVSSPKAEAGNISSWLARQSNAISSKYHIARSPNISSDCWKHYIDRGGGIAHRKSFFPMENKALFGTAIDWHNHTIIGRRQKSIPTRENICKNPLGWFLKRFTLDYKFICGWISALNCEIGEQGLNGCHLRLEIREAMSDILNAIVIFFLLRAGFFNVFFSIANKF